MPAVRGFERVVRQRRESSTTTIGPTMSSATYSVTRRAKLRGSSTRHRKLKLSSTFLMVPNRVQSSSARASGPTQARADAVGELHDLLRELARPCRPSGLKNSRMIGCSSRWRAEGLEHGECKRKERHQRQQRRVHESHGMEVDLAARQIAQQCVRITQHPQRQRAGRLPFGELAEQVAVEPVPEREDHRGRRISGPHPDVTIRLPRMPATYPDTHRLSHRGDHRDALPARRGRAHRRHLGLHRAPAARAAREAEGLRIHQREDRQDRRIEAGSGARDSPICRPTSPRS